MVNSTSHPTSYPDQFSSDKTFIPEIIGPRTPNSHWNFWSCRLWTCQDQYSSYRPSDWNEDSTILWFGKDHHHTTVSWPLYCPYFGVYPSNSLALNNLLPSFPVAQSCNNRIQNLLHTGSSCVNTNRTAIYSGLHIFVFKKLSKHTELVTNWPTACDQISLAFPLCICIL